MGHVSHREVPHDAFSIVEDVEYGIRIGQRGHRVWWVGEADVLGEMVSGEAVSRRGRRGSFTPLNTVPSSRLTKNTVGR